MKPPSGSFVHRYGISHRNTAKKISDALLEMCDISLVSLKFVLHAVTSSFAYLASTKCTVELFCLKQSHAHVNDLKPIVVNFNIVDLCQ